MGAAGRRPGAVAAAVLAVAVLIGGCSAEAGGRSSADSAKAPVQAPQAADAAGKAAGAAPAAPATGGAAGAEPAPAVTADSRLIAYTAQLTLVAKDLDQAMAQARGLAAGAGGYVGKETVSGAAGSGAPGGERDSGPLGGQIVLKVPSGSYQKTLDQLAALGKVVSRNSQADDLTQQVVDVASRVQSQQASVERVRALMAQAKSLADVVSLEAELSRRQADLESLQKQQTELTAKTSLSTITLELRRETAAPPPAEQAKKKDGFWAAVGKALGGGWHVLSTIAKGLLIALAAVAPFLLVLAPLGWMLWYLARRRKAARPAGAPQAPPRDPWSTPGDGPDPQ
ncbi:DUF4349 domain-containing protein [Kitasatospora sp. NBC_00240]|uniref:DUF4349 domain-containing protein n=1 Tax=Kitasatospora sp. NBC_00240 TaxID=2903567 RepID=UPI0022507652|nr:DUF4349 domain-containing protein [Kitasatospora sp. NBC_00240]MCX5210367.1 DUF4349 domain-containing protein [Kitasatospora sp. NBC_00240]